MHANTSSQEKQVQILGERKSLKTNTAFVKRVESKAAVLQDYRSKAALFHVTEVVKGAVLGKGGFAIVYEISGFRLRQDISITLSPVQRAVREKLAATAIDVNGKCRYAIKHLQSKLLGNRTKFSRAAADLVDEAAFLSVLDHPNILALHGLSIDEPQQVFSEDDTHDGFFLITERLIGTLDNSIMEWELNPKTEATLERKLLIAQQLADALKYLHEQRLVFRDLKPANIGFSLDDDNVVKLFDFGLCRELPKFGTLDDTYAMSGVGTRGYLAIEVLKRLPYNCKADVYGWSMVFWQMLTLRTPNMAAWQMLNLRKDVMMCDDDFSVCNKRSHIPSSIQVLLEHCWTEDISRRLTMNEVYKRIEEIKKDQQLIHNKDESEQLLCTTSTTSPAVGLTLQKQQNNSTSISTTSESDTSYAFTVKCVKCKHELLVSGDEEDLLCPNCLVPLKIQI